MPLLVMLVIAVAACGAARETQVYVVGALQQRDARVVVSDPGELGRVAAEIDPEVLVLEASREVLRGRDPQFRELPHAVDHRGVSSPFLRADGRRVYAGRWHELPDVVQRASAENPGRRILVVVHVEHRARVSRLLRNTPRLRLMEAQVSSVP